MIRRSFGRMGCSVLCRPIVIPRRDATKCLSDADVSDFYQE